MTFSLSAGVYPRVVDQSFVVSEGALLAGGIVISANRGPTGINTVTSARQFIDQYGVPSRDNPSMYSALRFLNRSALLTVRRVINDAVVASGDLPTQDALDTIFDFTAENPGVWGNDITISFGEVKGSNEGVFAVIVSFDGDEVETFEVSRDPDAKNGFGNNIYIEEVINNRSRYIRVTDNASVTEAPDLTATVELTGGSNDTAAPAEGDIIAAWDEFENVDSVEAQLLINAGWASVAVQQKMLSVAENRKDAVAILDVPQAAANDVQAMIDYRNDELLANTYFGGIYGGWLRVYDQFNDREVTIPPSGDVAAAFSFTVAVGERWDAPAGLQRGVVPNVVGVSRIFTEGERDQLYVNGINPVTIISNAVTIWGQKTLQVQASALDRFNVVNSVLWMQGRMTEALQPFVFQNNTAFTREQINFLLTSFLENVQVRGGLYDFYVDTSTEINSPQVIDNNQLLIDTYIQPVRAAEFIRSSLIITRTGVSLGG